MSTTRKASTLDMEFRVYETDMCVSVLAVVFEAMLRDELDPDTMKGLGLKGRFPQHSIFMLTDWQCKALRQAVSDMRLSVQELVETHESFTAA